MSSELGGCVSSTATATATAVSCKEWREGGAGLFGLFGCCC